MVPTLSIVALITTLAEGETISLPIAVLVFVGGVITSGVGIMAAIFAKGNNLGRWQGTVDTKIEGLEERLKRVEGTQDRYDGEEGS